MGVDPPRIRYSFDRFVLDSGRGALLDADGAELPLRPKSYALLLFLVQNAGRLLDRDSILNAVWPGVFVTDDSITQCVGEIRRALGEAGPRLLRTVPRRGYLFAAEVSASTVEAGPAPVEAAGPPAAPAPEIFVGTGATGVPLPVASIPAPMVVDPPVVGAPVVGPKRGAVRLGVVLAAGLGALLLLLPLILGSRSLPDPGATVAAVVPLVAPPTPREEATRLLAQGRAVGCPEQPCPREWLAARAFYEKAIAADPDFAPPYAEAAFIHVNFVTSGLSLNQDEDRRAAERLATRAAALGPELAIAHRARAGVLRLDPNRLEDALAAYSRSLSIEPNDPTPRGNAGWMLVLLGRFEEAEPMLRAALTVAPDHRLAPAWLTYLGLAELFMGREGHGAAHFRRAMAQQSRSAAAADVGLQRSLNLAAALALSGSVEEARLLVNDLRRQYSALSTRTLWNCDCSREPGFLSGYTTLRRGVVLAGVPATP